MMNDHVIDSERVRHRAYDLWMQRGCPLGSPEQDWLRAEQELSAARLAESARPQLHAAASAARSEARSVAIPRPRRPRSIVTRTPEAPAAQLLTTLAPSAPERESRRKATGGTRRRAT